MRRTSHCEWQLAFRCTTRDCVSECREQAEASRRILVQVVLYFVWNYSSYSHLVKVRTVSPRSTYPTSACGTDLPKTIVYGYKYPKQCSQGESVGLFSLFCKEILTRDSLLIIKYPPLTPLLYCFGWFYPSMTVLGRSVPPVVVG